MPRPFHTARLLLQQWLRRRARTHAKLRQRTIDRFHHLYYDEGRFAGGTWAQTYWLGTPVLKCPFDLWVYQEIIFQQRPDLILETGTSSGGSAAFLATICDLVQHGRIVSIDIEARPNRPQHPRIRYLAGSSIAPAIHEEVARLVAGQQRVMVLLDSDHSRDHVLDELRLFSRYVTKGQYLVVEDTNVHGHPVAPEHGPGPTEAIAAFLQETHDFVIDPTPEKFYLTFNPRGYLRRV
jgi:cephalosporin hydroxylase